MSSIEPRRPHHGDPPDPSDPGEPQAASPSPGAGHPDAQEAPALTFEDTLEILAHGRMALQGLLPYSSNYSFLATVCLDGVELLAVYKPRHGETPLWDFPPGTLCLREVAAFWVSRALGWDLVPPTVLRSQAPRGLGSLQLFIPHDPQVHYFAVQEDARFALAFRRTALFDYVVNNADRKSGHCLVDEEGRLWLIDHGICFHHEPKLRTVIWEYAGEPIEPPLLEDLRRLARLWQEGGAELAPLYRWLSTAEQEALRRRLEKLLAQERYPEPYPWGRNFPWPPI